jgi:alpha-1,6-mannosyltransferase
LNFAALANANLRGGRAFSRERSAWVLPGLGAAIVGLQVCGAIAQLDEATRVNVALILAQGALYVAAVTLLLRGAPVSLGWVLGVAVILRLTILFLPPFLSDDIYRYVWDGRVQGAGVNPYLYIPNDPALAGLRDPSIWPNINRGDYAPTIYPPIAQALFFLITRVTGSVVGMKIAWVLFEGVTAWGVVRLLDGMGLPRGRLLIYAWSPLAVWEIAGSGHLDAAMSAFVALAVLARMQNRHGFAGAALGLAVMVKFFPLVTLPALWRRGDWRLPAACAAIVAAGYLVYIGAGVKVLGFLSGYSREEGLRDGNGFWLAHLIHRAMGVDVPPLVYVLGVAVVLGALALVIMQSKAADKAISGAFALAAVGMIALSPNHPWYFVWLTPLLCFEMSLPVLWVIVVSPILFWPNPYSVPWNSDVLYGGAAVLVLVDLSLRIIKRRRLARGLQ